MPLLQLNKVLLPCSACRPSAGHTALCCLFCTLVTKMALSAMFRWLAWMNCDTPGFGCVRCARPFLSWPSLRNFAVMRCWFCFFYSGCLHLHDIWLTQLRIRLMRSTRPTILLVCGQLACDSVVVISITREEQRSLDDNNTSSQMTNQYRQPH